jgi:hypothetical protein
MRKEMRIVLAGLLLAVGLNAWLCSAQTAQGSTAMPTSPSGKVSSSGVPSSSASSEAIPVMDGGAGPCSLELTVTADTKPAAAANVKVHIVYGFAGVRKLDLDAYTNNEGKLKFTGLPSRVRRPPLEFRASKDKLAGTATYDPESECDAKHGIALVPKPDNQN